MWLSKEVYDGLYAYWESEKFKDKSALGKTNRALPLGVGTQGDRIPLPQLSTQTQMNIWKEVVGLTKKGKICRFGMEGSCAFSTSSSTTKQVPIEVLKNEKQLKKMLNKRLNRVEEKLDQTTKQLSLTNKLVKTLMKQIHFTIPLPINIDIGKGSTSRGGEDSDADDNDDDHDGDQQETEDEGDDEEDDEDDL
ncbi:hypothetical protein Cgig2_000061 [Carnegiea gigantea]|uniref:Uncharacterized protein n=1 Tax=Carnegiea gigantea TaxID=171969 RepID=A0A9Q1QS41_9CARY|nr:hypothetical protein Cgig2_000061 [Carnegiea gigantea]